MRPESRGAHHQNRSFAPPTILRTPARMAITASNSPSVAMSRNGHHLISLIML